ncbi:MAG: HAMP domain-containing histidine kinase [Thermoflexibacter sp.]|jgi:two-component system phosphate regulon sensor histidine kinase PhoR|nr:HAMP domain-containing histidine kinase [Thermoflexibacter sp.]
MTHNTFRFIIILAVISIVGIVITQLYWVRRAFDLKEKQFNQAVHIGLQDVAQQIASYNKHSLPSANVVNKISSDYYIVHINSVIDANVLEHYLKNEFIKHQVEADFEYGIYDCNTDKMVYGNYLSTSNKTLDNRMMKSELPKWDTFTYYFVVHFPHLTTDLASDMEIWVFSSMILLIVILFFSYTLFAIFKQKRLAEIQKDFINNMTHEFKTPISTIAISADVLGNPQIIQYPERLANYVSIIKNENNRLKNQVERVLQLAKLEKKELELKKEQFDLHLFIKEATASFALKIKEGKLENKTGELVYYLHATHALIDADKVHLTNLVYNLLDNSTKYCDEAPHIEITTQNQGNYILLSFKDNGIGIEKKYQKRIFEKFFRVPTGNLHDVKGFGLGLNYVKSVVEAHKWKISLESRVGEGCKFDLWIPKVLETKENS